MKQPKDHPADETDWARAVSRAEDHVRVESSGVAAAERPLPGMGALLVIVGLFVASGVAFVSRRLVASPRPTLSRVEQAADLRTEVGRMVQAIEAYRAEKGSLPPPELFAPYLQDGYVYRIVDPVSNRYEVRRSAGGVEVVYDGSLPLNLWLMVGGLNPNGATK